MAERWLTKLQTIEQVEPSHDLLERAEAGPLLPEPGPRPTARVTAVLVAVLVAAAGSWGAFAALRSTQGVGREPAGEADGFTALWPETVLADAQLVQDRADAGDAAVQWRTEAADVALRYAKEVLGWPDPVAGIWTEEADTVSVSLRGPIASCEAAGCEETQPQQIGVSLTLQRLVRPGDGGIWSVTALGPVSEPIGESRPRIGGWPEDVDGDGLISDTGDERIPALIRAVGDDGVTGYVRYADLEGGPQPSNPEEAVAMSGQERVIPVYAADSITVIDWLTISSGQSTPIAPSGASISPS
jgi:hypothetical protein